MTLLRAFQRAQPGAKEDSDKGGYFYKTEVWEVFIISHWLRLLIAMDSCHLHSFHYFLF